MLKRLATAAVIAAPGALVAFGCLRTAAMALGFAAAVLAVTIYWPRPRARRP